MDWLVCIVLERYATATESNSKSIKIQLQDYSERGQPVFSRQRRPRISPWPRPYIGHRQADYPRWSNVVNIFSNLYTVVII